MTIIISVTIVVVIIVIISIDSIIISNISISIIIISVVSSTRELRIWISEGLTQAYFRPEENLDSRQPVSSRSALSALHAQTLMSTDVQTPFLGTPLVPLKGTSKSDEVWQREPCSISCDPNSCLTQVGYSEELPDHRHRNLRSPRQTLIFTFTVTLRGIRKREYRKHKV